MFDTFEGDAVILAAPIITFLGTPYVTTEGGNVTLSMNVVPQGNNYVKIVESESDSTVASGHSITVQADFPTGFEAGLEFQDVPNPGDHPPHVFDAAEVESVYIRMIGEDDNDRVVWVGPEGNNNYIVTADTLFMDDRAALLFPDELENLELDGGLGDDQFFVHSIDADVSAQLFGGAGSDTFHLGGDAPSVIADTVVQPPLAGPHTLDGIQGAVVIDGAEGDCSPPRLGCQPRQRHRVQRRRHSAHVRHANGHIPERLGFGPRKRDLQRL